MRHKLKASIVPGLLIVVGYMTAFFLVALVITPLQSLFLPHITIFAGLVFLPHGVRVLATWLYREKALVPLLVAHLLMYRLFYWVGEDTASNMVAVLSGSFCAFIALQIFNFTRIDLTLNNLSISHWRSLIFFGFIASIFNTLGNMLALGSAIASELHIGLMVTFIVGDTLGTAACLVLLMLAMRFYRFVQKRGAH